MTQCLQTANSERSKQVKIPNSKSQKTNNYQILNVQDDYMLLYHAPFPAILETYRQIKTGLYKNEH